MDIKKLLILHGEKMVILLIFILAAVIILAKGVKSQPIPQIQGKLDEIVERARKVEPPPPASNIDNAAELAVNKKIDEFNQTWFGCIGNPDSYLMPDSFWPLYGRPPVLPQKQDEKIDPPIGVQAESGRGSIRVMWMLNPNHQWFREVTDKGEEVMRLYQASARSKRMPIVGYVILRKEVATGKALELNGGKYLPVDDVINRDRKPAAAAPGMEGEGGPMGPMGTGENPYDRPLGPGGEPINVEDRPVGVQGRPGMGVRGRMERDGPMSGRRGPLGGARGGPEANYPRGVPGGRGRGPGGEMRPGGGSPADEFRGGPGDPEGMYGPEGEFGYSPEGPIVTNEGFIWNKPPTSDFTYVDNTVAEGAKYLYQVQVVVEKAKGVLRNRSSLTWSDEAQSLPSLQWVFEGVSGEVGSVWVYKFVELKKLGGFWEELHVYVRPGDPIGYQAEKQVFIIDMEKAREDGFDSIDKLSFTTAPKYLKREKGFVDFSTAAVAVDLYREAGQIKLNLAKDNEGKSVLNCALGQKDRIAYVDAQKLLKQMWAENRTDFIRSFQIVIPQEYEKTRLGAPPAPDAGGYPYEEPPGGGRVRSPRGGGPREMPPRGAPPRETAPRGRTPAPRVDPNQL